MSQIDHAIHIKTIFCDIDGCVFKHHSNVRGGLFDKCELLPGVQKTFKQWMQKGYTIILTTGRPEGLRNITEKQICNHCLSYHHLIMGLPRGQRVVINDMKFGAATNTAACVNLLRDKGMEDVNI